MTVLDQKQLEPFHSCIESIFSEQSPSPLRAKAFNKLMEKGSLQKNRKLSPTSPLRQLYASAYAAPSVECSLSKDDIAEFVLHGVHPVLLGFCRWGILHPALLDKRYTTRCCYLFVTSS
jgi:hypothetical protein